MPDIHIRRDHALGLSKARELAWQWAEEVEQQFGMSCTVIEGETSDTVEFTRSGVDGRLTVAPDHFELDAKLGFLLGAFSRKIETEIERNLDALLGQAAQKSSRAAAGKSAAPKAAAKSAAVKSAGTKSAGAKPAAARKPAR